MEKTKIVKEDYISLEEEEDNNEGFNISKQTTSLRDKTNTPVKDILNNSKHIIYYGIEIPKEVFKEYEIFLEFASNNVSEDEIFKNLEIEESKIIWISDLYLKCIQKLPKDIKFPDHIGGDLDLGYLKEISDNFKFPDHIGGDLDLGYLEEIPDNIKFPDHIGGDLDLGYLEEIPDNIKFPGHIGGDLDLGNLEEISDNIKFPDHIGGDLDLGYLKEIPDNFKFPDHIGGDLDLGYLEEIPETIKINGDLMLNCNQNLTYLHNNIECKKLYIGNCHKLYTCNNYKIIKYLKENKKIEAVVGFPIGEIEGMMKKLDNIVVAILSEQDLVVYERYQVFPEDITDRLIEESIYMLEEVYESVNGYMLSKRDECIALKETIERITRIEEYKAIDKKLHKINKEIKDRPRIVRDRLRSIFSDELWEKVVERLKEEDPDMVKFLNKK